LVDQAITAQPAQIFVNTDEPEGPRARRGKLRQGRQSQREKLSSHASEAGIGGTPHAHAQRPERSSLTVLRSLFIQPAAVEAHEVVEPFRFEIEGVMEKSRAGRGQSPYAFRFLSQLTQ